MIRPLFLQEFAAVAEIIEVAIAILSQGDRVLMQLRDNIPNIIYPAHWGFFGGHLEQGETPRQAVEREVLEEIGYQIPSATLFGVYSDLGESRCTVRRDDGRTVIRHVFHAPLEVPLSELQLYEGWDFALLPYRSAKNGGEYSPVAQQWRPMPPIHQRILLDFFATP